MGHQVRALGAELPCDARITRSGRSALNASCLVSFSGAGPCGPGVER